MKNLTTTLILLLFSICLIGQEFAPIGAVWHYDKRYNTNGNIDYITLTVEKDTVINGETCREIVKSDQLGCRPRPDVEFLFSRNDTVFIFDSVFNEFQILINFNAEKGNFWETKVTNGYGEVDTATITVDSTSTTNINGLDLKVLFVNYYRIDEGGNPEVLVTKITEKLGAEYLFRLHDYSTEICAGSSTQGLRCYEDSEIGFYSTGLAESCDYTYLPTNVESIDLNSILTLYPNPTREQVLIAMDLKKELKYEIHDLTGQLLHSKYFKSTTQIDLTKFQNGVYLITFKLNDKSLGTRKIIKY